jgi:hypothetical protein
METTDAMLRYAKEFVPALGACMRESGKRAKELGLTRAQTLHVWRKTLEITLRGGGSTKEL